ncbi:hypothetical protein PI23P_06870 [Polaribacter irgensii 23-P]|uniref:Uncharacterized protein n=1 Tax=Polaribacter irgensii 23-P TaxID=313594 RepID=A4BYT3_9FLAO|nr:hypothetical protein PI23P_06870 [Polaribacter irgensii 23-P]
MRLLSGTVFLFLVVIPIFFENARDKKVKKKPSNHIADWMV